jgi:spermidine synthase
MFSQTRISRKKNLRRLIIWALIGTGISSVSVQLLTIREFLSQFHGNEISISLVLFCWLLLSGIGSLLARIPRRVSLTGYALLTSLIALWPLLQIVSIRILREILFIHGISPGFYQLFLFILITTAPYCLLIGFILPLTLKLFRTLAISFTSGTLYIMDNVGDIAGGALFSFVLVYWLKPFKTIAVTSTLLIIVSIIPLLRTRKTSICLAAIVPLVGFFIYIALNSTIETGSLSGQYGQISTYEESLFGRIVVTKEGRQHTFWDSGIPLYSDGDVIRAEEKSHYPLSQLNRVGNVLLISGGLGETMAEIHKYHPTHIDYVELDPQITQVAMELNLVEKSPLLTIINSDGRHYLKRAEKKYDAILMDLPDPETFQLNRFFTQEFFSLAKDTLTHDGVLSFRLSYSSNYISDIRRQKLSVVYTTARQYFRNILILPGEAVYFLCRNGPLWEDIPKRLAEKGIETDYIAGSFSGNVTQDRILKLRNLLDEEAKVNKDFKPHLMNIVFKEWFLRHGQSPKAAVVIFMALIALYILFMKREEYVLFSTGLATMGAEMLVIFSFQVIYGYIYLEIGAIVTAFLLGLLPGAVWGNARKDKGPNSLMITDMTLLFLLVLFFFWLAFVKSDLPPFVFLAYSFLFAFFCGYQFPIAVAIIGEEKSPAAGCLAADLSGAAVGTMATGTILIPLFGLQWGSIFLIISKISSIIVFLRRRR